MHDRECILHDVFRIVAVAEQLRCEEYCRANVPAYQYRECLFILTRRQRDELRVTAWILIHNEGEQSGPESCNSLLKPMLEHSMRGT